jgi:hypothetical protein
MSAIVSFGVAAFQAGIAALLVVSIRRDEPAAAINAAVALVASLSPSLVAAVLDWAGKGPLAVDPLLTLWLGLAGFLHSVGMLGPYDTVWWWDHVTHTISAALLAALVYAALVVTGSDATTVAALTVLATFGLGLVWEGIELLARSLGNRYGVEPVLVNYGMRDTVLDLGFDLVGAALVVLLDLRMFVPVLEDVWRVLG